MAKLPASLFNDVIGPVMRGPSSSHVAGAARIGALVRQSLGGDVRSVLVEFDVNGRPEKRLRRRVPRQGAAGNHAGRRVRDRPLRVLLGRPHHRVQPPYRGRKRQAEERVRFLVAVAEG